nr:MAG TPA: hypothetical protein [Caudoviricetes sp.]
MSSNLYLSLNDIIASDLARCRSFENSRRLKNMNH